MGEEPVELYESLQPVTSMKPVAVNPAISLKKLLEDLEAPGDEAALQWRTNQILARIQKAVARLKKAHTFSKQELSWLSRMEKYLLEETVLQMGIFDEDSRFKAQGGFERLDKIFRHQLANIVTELNDYLYDDGGNAA